jgi:putative ABC transport system permease protein
MRVLDRKLIRDLRRLWAQSLAIALVMACGVATLILAIGTYQSLDETRAAYYERYRFGDIFASATRAPNSLARQIAAIDGVAAVETRIASPVILDIPGLREPATGLAISVPESGDIAVNDIFLRQGRMPGSGHGNDVAVNWNFAQAHHFTVGSTFQAVINGSKVNLTIVGIALSPEYIYALGPGDMMPDNRRFGVIWMQDKLLAPMFDLNGAFNSVSLRLLPGASETAVVEALDRILEPYGGTGAYGRKDQLSNAFLDGELVQLKGMAEIIPPIFLAVSAFLINMILSRLISLEREQIGLLKALGYSRLAVVWHYLKLVLAIAAIGALIGIAAGNWLGHALTRLYAEFYSFPFLLFRETADIYLIAVGISFAAAVLGALRAVSTAFALPAAVAMRPPAPAVYRQVFGGALKGRRIFSQLTTMALRHVVRRPVRSVLSAIGIAFSVALVEVALGTMDSVEAMLDAIYYRTDRQDATLAFNTPRGPGVVTAARHLPGVMTAEPYLDHPVRISNGHYSRQLAITGKPPGTDLSRVLDLDLKPVVLPPDGLALGDRVAQILHVTVGDQVRVALLDSDRRVVEAPVTQIIQSYIGLMVYMDIDALARLAGTGPRVSGVHVALDSARLDDLYAAVKKTPQVSSVALQTVSRQRMQETMQQNMNISLFVYFALAIIIAFGVIYNSARIQLSERARELASLRVLGFRRGEVSSILFIEVGVVVALAQPIGWLVGTGFGVLITQSLATDIFRVPFVIALRTYAVGSLVVVAAALLSAAIVRRRIDRFDLIQVLKTRE